jgi:4-hydroxythreonine-4-phosphate dehydrogenase
MDHYKQELPLLGVTMGDSGGIGPEIVLKTLLDSGIRQICRPVVFGHRSVMDQISKILGIDVKFVHWSPGMEETIAWDDPGTIALYEAGAREQIPLSFGKPSVQGGEDALAAITATVDLALTHKIQAVVTAPVAKESLYLAGCPHMGHTELLAKLTGSVDYTMMLSLQEIHVIHTTVHLPLVEACALLSTELILRRIRLASRTAVRLGLETKPIAVCGLNPHAGENGLLGTEEQTMIIPAIELARREGLLVEGPFSPDTVFRRILNGEYAILLVMYHDQGHIPVKLLGMMDGVNVTLGLPFVRTSVDHGTAFGKAGKGTADPGSLITAVRMAVRMGADWRL